jgi:hypothetical protein
VSVSNSRLSSLSFSSALVHSSSRNAWPGCGRQESLCKERSVHFGLIFRCLTLSLRGTPSLSLRCSVSFSAALFRRFLSAHIRFFAYQENGGRTTMGPATLSKPICLFQSFVLIQLVIFSLSLSASLSLFLSLSLSLSLSLFYSLSLSTSLSLCLSLSHSLVSVPLSCVSSFPQPNAVRFVSSIQLQRLTLPLDP